jgi:CRP/FNR family transcriptional regulator
VQSTIDNPCPRTACSGCPLRRLCLPVELSGEEIARMEVLTSQKRPVQRGEYLFRRGDDFRSLYAIRSGFFKTQVLHKDGREQVTGFQMPGEIIGLDAISSETHACDAVALEDGHLCEIPYDRLEALSREMPGLQRHLHKLMSREIVREHGIMMLLGSMRAEERLATFLLNLSQRFDAIGQSPTALYLRMTRQEIGSYLGLKLETVSRTLSQFQEHGLLSVRLREVEIMDMLRLRSFVGTAA